jgi:hypothetical protein
MNDVASTIADAFEEALLGDLYPAANIERLFGIVMGTQLGQDVLGAWITLRDTGYATTAAITDALRSDTLPEAFNTWIRQSPGSTYRAAAGWRSGQQTMAATVLIQVSKRADVTTACSAVYELPASRKAKSVCS